MRENVQRLLSGVLQRKQPEKTRIKGIMPRIQNIMVNNYSGLLGVLVPVAALSWQYKKEDTAKTAELMWMCMLWFYLIRTIPVPIVGLMPIFILPMLGTMNSVDTCKSYMNDSTILFVLTSMLILLLNNSGIDRRIALWFICSGDNCQYSGKRLVFKVSSAAFFLSMFSSRLIAAGTLMDYITPALTKLHNSSPKSADYPNFIEMRHIINNAISTSCGIGALAVLHSAPATILFRGAFHGVPPANQDYPDIFNYLQYSAFAFPVAFVMFFLNVAYHMWLINWYIGKTMSNASMSELRSILIKTRAESIPRKWSTHERLSILFCIIVNHMFFFRWNQWIYGWADYSKQETAPDVPKVKDATTAAIFIILLHSIPKGYGFLQYVDAEKKSELPPIKPESGILWWKFVDRNVNYGYFFTMGSCFALVNVARHTGLDLRIAENIGKIFTEKPWNGSIFLVCFITTILANLMTAMAACSIFVPFVCAMAIDAALPWPGKVYCAALAVGMASSFGFCLPYKYTPSYYCHFTGKVPLKKMVKYSFLSVWICLLTLWVALLLYAPYLFDPKDNGIYKVTVGKAAEGGGGGEGAGPTETTATD